MREIIKALKEAEQAAKTIDHDWSCGHPKLRTRKENGKKITAMWVGCADCKSCIACCSCRPTYSILKGMTEIDNTNPILEAGKGLEIYEEMMNDPVIKSLADQRAKWADTIHPSGRNCPHTPIDFNNTWTCFVCLQCRNCCACRYNRGAL